MDYDPKILEKVYGVSGEEIFKIDGDMIIINSPPNGDFYYKIDKDAYETLLRGEWLSNNYDPDVSLHNENGPACNWHDENYFVEWYIHGKKLSFEQWCEKLEKTEEDIVLLKLMYGSRIDGAGL